MSSALGRAAVVPVGRSVGWIPPDGGIVAGWVPLDGGIVAG